MNAAYEYQLPSHLALLATAPGSCSTGSTDESKVCTRPALSCTYTRYVACSAWSSTAEGVIALAVSQCRLDRASPPSNTFHRHKPAALQSLTKPAAFTLQLAEVSTVLEKASRCGAPVFRKTQRRGRGTPRHTPRESSSPTPRPASHLHAPNQQISTEAPQQQSPIHRAEVAHARAELQGGQSMDVRAVDHATQGLAAAARAAPGQILRHDVRLLMHQLDSFKASDLFLGRYVLLGRGERRQGGARPSLSWECLPSRLLQSWMRLCCGIAVVLACHLLTTRCRLNRTSASHISMHHCGK